MAKKFTAPQYSKFISVISRYAHPASAGFCLAILHRPTAFSVAIFCPALQPYPTPSLGRCDGTADRRRRGPEHARADRNDASTAKVGADSGTGHAGNARGSAGSRELPYAERVLRWADDFTLFRLYGDLLGAIA